MQSSVGTGAQSQGANGREGIAGAGPKGHLQTIATLIRYLWPPGETGLKTRVVTAAFLIVCAKLANVGVPFLYKEAVDMLDRPAGLIAVPVVIILAYGAARILAQGFGELRNAVFAKVSQHAVRTIALETFEHLHRLSLRFHLERQTGGLSRAIERGNAGIQFALSFTLFNILPTIFEIGLVCVLLLIRYDGWFALATFTTIALYVILTLVLTEWRIKLRREMNERDAEANTRAIDSLLNYETVKYFGNEPHEASRYDRALERYQKAAVASEQSLSILNVGQGCLIAGGLCAVMLLAGHGVVQGTMTLGDFVLVNTFLIQLYQPLNILGMVYREVKQSLVDMERMFQLLHVDEEVRDAPDAKPLVLKGGEVEFRDVHFAYDARRPILKGVSFKVPAGRTVAIVGSSGAGKSTISRLLFRFYDVQAGAILIDGQDLREVTQASLRHAIGIVPQDTVLFNDTIRYNIRYGRPKADEDEIRRAAELAKIDRFVEHLPDGWRTRVGERGLKLSGGEKQRVAIARTILKDPTILLFDEATSALDTRTEKEIQASLREVSRDRTTLIIAHRLSTIIHADEILVLDEGRVVERGGHAELLAHDGQYAAMWARQQEVAEARERLQAAETSEE